MLMYLPTTIADASAEYPVEMAKLLAKATKKKLNPADAIVGYVIVQCIDNSNAPTDTKDAYDAYNAEHYSTQIKLRVGRNACKSDCLPSGFFPRPLRVILDGNYKRMVAFTKNRSLLEANVNSLGLTIDSYTLDKLRELKPEIYQRYLDDESYGKYALTFAKLDYDADGWGIVKIPILAAMIAERGMYFISDKTGALYRVKNGQMGWAGVMKNSHIVTSAVEGTEFFGSLKKKYYRYTRGDINDIVTGTIFELAMV